MRAKVMRLTCRQSWRWLCRVSVVLVVFCLVVSVAVPTSDESFSATRQPTSGEEWQNADVEQVGSEKTSLPPVVASDEASSDSIELVITDTRQGRPVVTVRTAKDLAEAQRIHAEYAGIRDVEIAQQIIYRPLGPIASTAGQDPLRSRQWALDQMDVPQAWSAGATGQGIVVSVVDTGVANHPDLDGKVIARRNFVTDDGSLADMRRISTSHGTAVAGIIAGIRNNSVGVSGIAPDVQLLDATVCANNSCKDADIANAIIWSTDQGADVINMSLGGGAPSASLSAAIQYAVERDVVIVAAAGNSACKHLIYGQTEYGPNGNCMDDSRSASWPANFDGVLSVAAIERTGLRASYSSYGPQVAIGAPTAVITAGPGQYQSFNGTSAASPHVAAVAALVRSARPALTAKQVMSLLQSTATNYATTLTQKTWASCGEYSPTLMYWTDCTGLNETAVAQRELGGAGLVNAGAAVAAAQASALWATAPSVTTSATSLTIDVASIASADEYQILIDGRVQKTVTSTGPTTVTSLLSNARYAVQVRALNDGAVVSTSAPVRVTTPLTVLESVPVVTSANVDGDGEIIIGFSKPTVPIEVPGLFLVNSAGAVVNGCNGGGELFNPPTMLFRCRKLAQVSSSEVFRVKWVDIQGSPGPLSSSFNFVVSSPTSRANTSPTASISSSPSVVHLTLTKDVDTSNWDITPTGFYVSGIGTAFRVSNDGVLLTDGLEFPPVCSATTTTVSCDVPAQNGRLYYVVVKRSHESLESFGGYKMLYARPEPAPVGEVSNVRILRRTADDVVIGWDSSVSAGDLIRGARRYAFNVYTSDGVDVGSSWDETDGWSTRLPLRSYSEGSLGVSVLGFEWSYSNNWWLTEGEMTDATLTIDPLDSPDNFSCWRANAGINCSLTPISARTSNTRYRLEVRKTDGEVVASAYQIYGYSQFASIPFSLEANSAYVVAIRTEQDIDDGRVSAYSTTNIAALSSVSTLSGLSVSSGTLSPAFASGTTSYSVTVPNSVSQFQVTPTVSHVNSVIRVGESTVTSGNTSNWVSLSVGANNVAVAVTAEDGVSSTTYVVTVTREALSNPTTPTTTPPTTTPPITTPPTTPTPTTSPVTTPTTQAPISPPAPATTPTTQAPISPPAPATTPAAPQSLPVVKVSISAGKTVTIKNLLKQLKVSPPPNATSAIRIATASKKVCTAKGNVITGRAKGTCQFSVTFTQRIRSSKGTRVILTKKTIRVPVVSKT